MMERKSEEGKKKGEEKSERKQYRRGNDKYLVGEVKKLPAEAEAEAKAAAGRKVEGGWGCIWLELPRNKTRDSDRV